MRTERNLTMSEIEEIYKYMAEYVSKFTFPLLTCEADERYDLFGTCVAIEISGKKFLLTASHVVEELIKSKKQAVVALSSGPIIRINLVDAVHFVREGAELDSCIIGFEHAPPAAEFLTNEELFTEKDELFQGIHFIQGYPISKNKMVKINDHDNREVRSGYFSVFLKLDNKIEHRFEKINNRDHVLFLL